MEEIKPHMVEEEKKVPSETSVSHNSPSHKKFLFLGIGAVVVLALVGGAYVLGSKRSATNVKTTVTETPETSGPDGFPVYPGAELVKKEEVPPCSDADKAQELPGCRTADSVAYEWETPDDYDKVRNFYKNDPTKSGWACVGGAGSYDGPRSAVGISSCTNKSKNLDYPIGFVADATTTTITLYVPNSPTSDSSAESTISSSVTRTATSVTPSKTVQITAAPGMKIYNSPSYGFSFQYPQRFVYANASTPEWISLLEKQGDIMAQRMYVQVDTQGGTFDQVIERNRLNEYFGMVPSRRLTTINGREAMILTVNASQKQFCNGDDETPVSRTATVLIKGNNGNIIVFYPNETCDTFKTDWFSQIPQTIVFR